MLLYGSLLGLRCDDADSVLLAVASTRVQVQHGERGQAHLHRRSLPHPIVQLGQHFYNVPVGFCDDSENNRCVVLPNYSGKPAVVSPAFVIFHEAGSRAEHRRLGVVHGAEHGSASSQYTAKITLRSQRQYPSKGLTMDGLKQNRKTASLQNGSDDGAFEDEWQEERVREHLPKQDDLWEGYTAFLISEVAQKYRFSFRAKQKRHIQQHTVHERGLRLKGQALRLAERTMANRPSGETYF